ncbi:MAG: hypothetical protein EBT14_06815, partial [Betaproteobacteria bacterium]|nr:hypothetical protein [Betaproteobacteria bacterium]
AYKMLVKMQLLHVLHKLKVIPFGVHQLAYQETSIPLNRNRRKVQYLHQMAHILYDKYLEELLQIKCLQ